MHFKFHDENGNEVWVADQALFTRMVNEGRIRPDTLLFDANTSLWKRAWEFSDYQSALASLNAWREGFQSVPSYGEQGLGASQDGSILFGQPAIEPPGERQWAFALASFLTLAGFAIVLVTGLKFSSTIYSAGYRIGFTLGSTIWIGILAWLISRFALKNEKGIAFLLFACGFFVVSITQSVAAYREGQAARLAVNDIAATMREMINGGAVSSIDGKQYGEYGPMVQIISDFAREVNAEMTAMAAEVQELHPDTLLVRETIENSGSIDKGRQRLQMLLGILDRCESSLKQRSEEIPNKVAASSMNEAQKREFIAGFNTTKDAGLNNISEFFSIERSFVAKVDEIYGFLQGRQGRYKFMGNQPVFVSQSDLSTYNQYISDLNRITRQESDWITKTQFNSEQQVNKMQRMMKR